MKAPSKQIVTLWYYVVVAACCMIFYGYDASVFSAVETNKNWVDHNENPSDNALGGINTAYTVGAIISGWFFSGLAADRFGRKFPIYIGCFLVIIATIMQVCQPRGIGVFLGGRLIIGVAQGFALPSAAIYISEISVTSMRGQTVSIFQVFYSVGSFICFWINYACTKHSEKLGNWDWKIVVIFQLLAPLYILFNLPFMPETPRWLVSKNKFEEARAALVRIRPPNEDEIDMEFHDIRAAIEFEHATSKPTIWNQYKSFWVDKSLLRRILISFVINGGQQLTGQGSLNSYSSKIYAQVFKSQNTIQLINALNATFGILFTLNALWIVERFGRRPLLLVSAIGMGISMLIVSLVETQVPPGPDGKPTHAIGIVTVFLFFLYELFYKPGWGGTVWIYTSEIFPMEVRGIAVGMSSQFQNVANAIVNQFFPTFLAKKGFYAMFLFFAINTCLAVFTWFFIPETKGKSLEEIDTLFGGVNHIQKGDQLHNGSLQKEMDKASLELIEKVSTRESLKKPVSPEEV
ncbi:hypothetical protein DASC09_008030 [Saccharomycopsis crataegensis]|uniref:Major facilitator superfamily (MFS) profile domain-containing protein n=1 Tax=Saccharomycopsis crataegensis TaxID=43959 RepID=A0AAV5QH27_9ASCO|nr:hypothetical protein DASC09_008030 [Saccharomycopsis crataegensis]